MLSLPYSFSAELIRAVMTVLARNIHLLFVHEEWPTSLKKPFRDLTVDELRDLLYDLSYFELHGSFPSR